MVRPENPPTAINPKESDGYLTQISHSPEEKVGEVVNAVETDLLPKTPGGQIRILELGTGGGESLSVLKKALAARTNVDVYASDISHGILRKIRSEQDVGVAAADAAALPFANESLSAVNASAVMHEVSSYGISAGHQESKEHGAFGLEAVRNALTEIHEVLLPRGLFAYRDVHCPDNMFEEKTIQYTPRSWSSFAQWFFDGFESANARAFPTDSRPLMANGRDGSLKLTATKHLHRELQRHYIMFRDYLRTQLAPQIGLDVVDEQWADKQRGIKQHTFVARDLVYSLLSGTNAGAGYGHFTMESTEYDRLFDQIIAQLLDHGSAPHQQLDVELSDWKKREGKEIYTYGSTADVLTTVIEAGRRNDDGHILMPRQESDIQTIPRNYYNRFLTEGIDDPEFDGKQVINFYKIPTEEADGVLLKLKEHLSPDAMQRIQEALETEVAY